jgi:hypothetical protein
MIKNSACRIIQKWPDLTEASLFRTPCVQVTALLPLPKIDVWTRTDACTKSFFRSRSVKVTVLQPLHTLQRLIQASTVNNSLLISQLKSG